MGATGGASPKPWSAYTVSTRFLRVPSPDWAGVKLGLKREFRTVGRRAITAPDSIEVPTPVVAYRLRQTGGGYDSQLMVLVATWREPLGAISEESLANEGFSDIANFRRYWMNRTHRRFTPLTLVQVYRLRTFEKGDDAELGWMIFRRLYKEHL